MFSLPDEVTEAITEVAETLLPVYFERGYTGVKREIRKNSEMLRIFQTEEFSSSDIGNACCDALWKCWKMLKRIKDSFPPGRKLFWGSYPVVSLYNTLVLAMGSAGRNDRMLSLYLSDTSFFLPSFLGLRKTGEKDFEEEYTSLLNDFTHLHSRSREYLIPGCFSITEFLYWHPLLAEYHVGRKTFLTLLKDAKRGVEKLDSGIFLPLIEAYQISLPRDEKEKELTVTSLYRIFLLAAALPLLPEETIHEVEEEYVEFLRVLIRKLKDDKRLTGMDVSQSGSSIIPVLFALLFGFFPVEKLDREISDFAGKTFSRSLFRFARERCSFLINKKVMCSLARIAERHGKSIFTYLPLSLVKELPKDTPFSLKNRVGILKKFIRHKESIKRLPFSGDITDALLRLSPKEIVLFINTALYRIEDLSNISLDLNRIRKVAEMYAVADYRSSEPSLIKYRLELLENLIGKNEAEIRLTILQKIDEALKKGSAERAPEKQLEKVIREISSAESSFSDILAILYLLSLAGNSRTTGFLAVIEEETGMKPARKEMIDFYLNVRKITK